MNYRDENITIGDVVVGLGEASKIFDKYGIDYCCGGHRPFHGIIEQQGIDKEALFKELDEAIELRKSGYANQKSFDAMAPGALSNYIEDKHHGYLREVLPEAAELLDTILRVHGRSHKELFKVYSLFGQLKTELEQHLLKEETLLFPIMDMGKEKKDEITELTSEIISEHEGAGEILRALREVTNDYEIPQDVCRTFARTYELLIEIEDDLHQHIHLENNILLKEYSDR